MSRHGKGVAPCDRGSGVVSAIRATANGASGEPVRENRKLALLPSRPSISGRWPGSTWPRAVDREVAPAGRAIILTERDLPPLAGVSFG